VENLFRRFRANRAESAARPAAYLSATINHTLRASAADRATLVIFSYFAS
jgi:hypothetical protein